MKPNRSRRRGAIMVEAVVVISFFILAFLGIVYFRTLYTEKLHVQRVARAAAMNHAMSGCRADPKTGVGDDLGQRAFQQDVDSEPPFPVPIGDPQAAGQFNNIRGKYGDDVAGITTIRVTGSATTTTKQRENAPEEGFRSTVSSTSFVACGDPVTTEKFRPIVEEITKHY